MSWVILELLVVAGQQLGTIFNLAIHLVFLIVFSGLQIGFIKICLNVCMGNNPPYTELFKSLNQGAKLLVAQLVFLVMVLIGLLLLIVPGFYLGARFAFFGFDMAEMDSKIIDSFRASAMVADNSIGKLAYYLLVLTLLNLIGAAFLGLGLLMTVPVSALTMTSLYQDLKSKTASG
jgi:uncharacterized membrane protein